MQSSAIGIKELGAIKDYLKILSDDKKGFRPQALRDVTGLNLKAMSETTGIARPRLYSEVVTPKPSSKLMLKILHVVIAADEVYELMNNNGNDAALWLNTPNAAFLGYSPFEICMQGRGEEVIHWLRVRTGKEPSSGF